MSSGGKSTVYLPPAAEKHPLKWLVAEGGVEEGERFAFYGRLEIGRFRRDRQAPGRLLLKDTTVSTRHCVITQEADGRCFIRDVSRNGTRLDERRLSPNLRTELEVGQTVSVGKDHRFRLEGDRPRDASAEVVGVAETEAVTNPVKVTVLVGDIRNYTTMVERVPSARLRESVARVFQRLERAVVHLGGTVKEFQGDAIFAFWEEGPGANHAVEACRAALRLSELAQKMAGEQDLWEVEEFPLVMDWALATGPVVIQGHGGQQAVGLSMIGGPVVLAFRIEKFAEEGTGPIITCPETRRLSGDALDFEEIGTRRVKGFDRQWRLFSLVGEKDRAADARMPPES